MRGRSFNKRVEIWTTTAVPDTFGGNTVSEALTSSSWAKIETVKPSRGDLNTDNGILDASNSIMITLRKRNDLNYNMTTMFVKYRGENYIIDSFPANIDFEDSTIKIVCTKEGNNATGEDLNSNL